MVINVTEKHVKQAHIDLSITPNELGYRCPVSQCLREMFPEVNTIVTGIDTIIINHTKYVMSERLQYAVLNFDIMKYFPIGQYEIMEKE